MALGGGIEINLPVYQLEERGGYMPGKLIMNALVEFY